MDLKWSDTEELAIRLVEAHPTTDPSPSASPTCMRGSSPSRIQGRPEEVERKTLESIQMAWHEEYQDSQS